MDAARRFWRDELDSHNGTAYEQGVDEVRQARGEEDPRPIGSVQTFLDRYVALRDGTDPNRADTRDANKAAAKTLEDRNIVTRVIEQELRAQIEIVKQPASVPTRVQVSAPKKALQQAAAAFEAWLTDWRSTAQVGIYRRDYRIMLGVSRRRVSVNVEEDDAASPQTGVLV